MGRTRSFFLIFLLWVLQELVISVDIDCKRAHLKINHVRNCHDGDHIIRILENSTVEMNDNCEIFSYMCSYLEPYTQGSFEVSIFKNEKTHFEDKVDLCHKPKKAHHLAQISMALFSVPFVCPVAFNYTSCAEGKKIFSGSDESKKIVHELWNDGGFVKIRANITHDTGKSCMEGEIQLTIK